ncbi:MAG: DMT family transporter [Deinococcales bacterium]
MARAYLWACRAVTAHVAQIYHGAIEQFMGIAAIGLGGLAYAAASLIIRPLLRIYGALTITLWQMMVGGLSFLGLSLLFADISIAKAFGSAKYLLSLVYLVLVGSLLGFGIYNYLLTTWEPSRVTLYNFLCPVIALILGMLVYGERVEGSSLPSPSCS